MEGMEEGQGAANIYDLWQEKEGYTPDGPFLILSGGDNWTGPAISTWTQGKSMVEVMNAMNYDASAVGNHEFDFGLDELKTRIAEAQFPYLSANTRWKADGRIPLDLGILPYTFKTVNDLKVGIIGLTTQGTSTAANPAYVSVFNFVDYEPALRETLPEVAAEDPDIVLVISHVCVPELERLIRNTQDLNITMMGAGHCNELVARRIGNTVLLGGGFHFSSYASIDIEFDLANDRVTRTRFDTHEYIHEGKDPEIASIVDSWATEMEQELSVEVAYLDRSLERRSDALSQLIIDSWLVADDSADVAITNLGGIRADLEAGPVNVGDVVAVLPFDNTIVAVEMTGEELLIALEQGERAAVAGLERRGRTNYVTSRGAPLEDNETYRVLVNSFMYAGGSGWTIFAEVDPDAYDTGINYHQPFQDWLQQQNSSAEQPLQLD